MTDISQRVHPLPSAAEVEASRTKSGAVRVVVVSCERCGVGIPVPRATFLKNQRAERADMRKLGRMLGLELERHIFCVRCAEAVRDGC